MAFEDLPPVYTLAQVAERWGCSTRHVRELIETGQLRAFRLGAKLWRVRHDAVDEYERRAAVPPSEAASSQMENKDKQWALQYVNDAIDQILEKPSK